mmetsp:Transcript_46458/g.140966  ORF Transcript_46458/g.140966 Transcript_46458/m.140966 type:complete len:276 (+) Transcript_46458:193-1020(+)
MAVGCGKRATHAARRRHQFHGLCAAPRALREERDRRGRLQSTHLPQMVGVLLARSTRRGRRSFFLECVRFGCRHPRCQTNLACGGRYPADVQRIGPRLQGAHDQDVAVRIELQRRLVVCARLRAPARQVHPCGAWRIQLEHDRLVPSLDQDESADGRHVARLATRAGRCPTIASYAFPFLLVVPGRRFRRPERQAGDLRGLVPDDPAVDGCRDRVVVWPQRSHVGSSEGQAHRARFRHRRALPDHVLHRGGPPGHDVRARGGRPRRCHRVQVAQA